MMTNYGRGSWTHNRVFTGFLDALPAGTGTGTRGSTQVGAATPMMAGVFSILKGCDGVEEQAIARALHFLGGAGGGGGGSGGGGGRNLGVGSFPATEEAGDEYLEEQREEWRAHREASMAVLVQRAMSTSTPGEEQVQGRGGVLAAAGRKRGGRRRGGKNPASAYRSRRLQVGGGGDERRGASV